MITGYCSDVRKRHKLSPAHPDNPFFILFVGKASNCNQQSNMPNIQFWIILDFIKEIKPVLHITPLHSQIDVEGLPNCNNRSLIIS